MQQHMEYRIAESMEATGMRMVGHSPTQAEGDIDIVKSLHDEEGY